MNRPRKTLDGRFIFQRQKSQEKRYTTVGKTVEALSVERRTSLRGTSLAQCASLA